MNDDILRQRVSDCVHPKHGKGVVYLINDLVDGTHFCYIYEDDYKEHLLIRNDGRRKKLKYGFLKAFRGKFGPLPDSPLRTVPTDKYNRTVTKHSIKYEKKEVAV